MARYLLCRPVGGLNDILCQVERCCRYAEAFDRTVVVDTNFARTRFFRDEFDRYFVSRDARLVLSARAMGPAVADGSVRPAVMRGRLDDYRLRHDDASGLMLDAATGVPLTFDFARDHDEHVLLHHQHGGGEASAQGLSRLTIARPLADELARRWAAIGPGYDAIHVRHTDYRSNYRDAIGALREAASDRLFVATDNGAVLRAFQQALGRGRVYSFSLLGFMPGEPIHTLILDEERTYQRNGDAVLDLLMLALARDLYLLPVENNPHGAHSGYSMLARSLHEDQDRVRRLIDDPRFEAILRHVPPPHVVGAASG